MSIQLNEGQQNNDLEYGPLFFLQISEQTQEVHYLAGEDCIMVKLRVKNNSELETILNQKIAILEGVKETQTYIALSTYKESAKIMLPETI